MPRAAARLLWLSTTLLLGTALPPCLTAQALEAHVGAAPARDRPGAAPARGESVIAAEARAWPVRSRRANYVLAGAAVGAVVGYAVAYNVVTLGEGESRAGKRGAARSWAASPGRS